MPARAQIDHVGRERNEQHQHPPVHRHAGHDQAQGDQQGETGEQVGQHRTQPQSARRSRQPEEQDNRLEDSRAQNQVQDTRGIRHDAAPSADAPQATIYCHAAGAAPAWSHRVQASERQARAMPSRWAMSLIILWTWQ